MPEKMPIPFVSARVKQSHEFGARCESINPRQIRALVAIIMQARKSKIAERSRSAVFLRDDVLNLEWSWMEATRKPTVFASVLRAVTDGGDKSFIHDV